MIAAAAKRFLVTGGAGYLAASLIDALNAPGIHIRRMFRAGRQPPGAPGGPAVIEDLEGDVTVPSDMERATEGVDVIFHLAAQTSVYKAEADPRADLQANVVPMLHILEACRARRTCPAVFLAGTATEVGLPTRLPVDESFPDRPCTVYDVHKLQAEQYLKHYVRSGIVRGASLRLANIYGPGPKSGSADRGVLNAMVRRALRGETLTIYGTGEFVRDYVYVTDAARCFARAAADVDAVSGRHFVIGSGIGHTVAQAVQLVADLVAERVGRPVRVEHTPPPASLSPIESRNFVARVDAFEEATGFKPGVTLRTGIAKTIEYVLASEQERSA